MPAQQTTTDGSPPVVVVPLAGKEEQVRKLAVEQIERKTPLRHRPITEDEIRREMDRLRGAVPEPPIATFSRAVARRDGINRWQRQHRANRDPPPRCEASRAVARSSIRATPLKS